MLKSLISLIVFFTLIFFFIALLATYEKLNTALQSPRDPTTDFNKEKGSNEWLDPTGNYKG